MLELHDFQKRAVEFALARKRSYLGLDPRLGKTAVAATISKKLNAASVYICPPFLVLNTEEEFDKWESSTNVFSDAMIDKPMTQNVIAKFIEKGKALARETVLFVDEAHRFKNPTANRTKALFKLTRWFDRVVYMSGTPMPNRPMELYPILKTSAPETINNMNKFEFGLRYCAGHKTPFGWDFSGSSNMPELAKRVIGTFMMRVRREDVLDVIPPTEEIIILDGDLPLEKIALEKRILEEHSPEDLMKSKIELSLKTESLNLATYRRELGSLKIKAALKYINYLLQETDEKLVIFAHHKEVITHLYSGVECDAVTISGETPMSVRHERVKKFKNDNNCRAIIGNIQAAGIGLNFSKSNRVIFVEFSWVDAENKQAADRVFEMGKKSDIFINYLVYRNSIDKAVIETVLRKRKLNTHI